jgi:hypothetical protein
MLGVTKARIENDVDVGVTFSAFQAPVHLVNAGARIIGPGHVVGEPNRAAAADLEQSLEHVGVRVVTLKAFVRVRRGRQRRDTAAHVVEKRGEHAGTIETRKAQPIDGPVHPHQRTRGAVANQTMRAQGKVIAFGLRVEGERPVKPTRRAIDVHVGES